MTKIKFNKGWRYLHIVKDWYNKEIIGWQLSFTSTTDVWLEALNQAVNKRFPWGIHTASHKLQVTDASLWPKCLKRPVILWAFTKSLPVLITLRVMQIQKD